jgi:hypothetical protein
MRRSSRTGHGVVLVHDGDDELDRACIDSRRSTGARLHMRALRQRRVDRRLKLSYPVGAVVPHGLHWLASSSCSTWMVAC